MLDSIFNFLKELDEIFWGYFAFFLIIFLGCIFIFRGGGTLIRSLPETLKIFFSFLKRGSPANRGIHPLKAFFASTGGMIGIGNVVGIATAVQMGGPGALVWVWIAGIIGAIVKYCEIYLGFKYRQPNKEGSYNGGPMYFLKKAFKNRWIPLVVALLLCIYAIEIYQFSVITDSVSINWHFNRYAVIMILLLFVLYASIGGVSRIGQICSWVMPFFIFIYIAMGFWVILQEFRSIPLILLDVFKSAFVGHAAVGGFAGSTIILTIQHGIARAAYSADIGVGYDSIIQSESATLEPEKQARLAILGVCLDNLICTFSILVVLVSGVWKSLTPLEGSQLIQTALESYFPYMHLFIPFFFIITGFTTITTYFVVGIKCASYLAPRFGKYVYIVYGITALILFSLIPQNQALLVMSVSGSILLVINLLGIFRLRKEIVFEKINHPVEKAA
ncbi:MAG: amino acid carrier protein [Chlamydiales bacterium]